MKPRKYRAKTMPQLLGVFNGEGKHTESKWAYGYYAPTYLTEVHGKIQNTYCIISDDIIGEQEILGCGHYTGLPKAYHIIEDTLSQSIGLFDKNGKEIFEGDIISSNHYPFIDDNKQNYVGVIEYIPELASFQYILNCVNPDKNGISNGINEQLEANDDLIVEDFEVIGNLWDNPELLEEKYERDTI